MRRRDVIDCAVLGSTVVGVVAFVVAIVAYVGPRLAAVMR